MDERVKFIGRWKEPEEDNFSALCAEFGISRKTGYKWLKRYEEKGAEGLAEVEPGWPKGEHRKPTEMVDAVLELRKVHPKWGPKKLRACLLEQQSEWELPTASTIGEWLKSYGQIAPRKRRLKVPGEQGNLGEALEPNDVWAIDFKGDFEMGDGHRVYPLTLSDLSSRYVLKCEGELSKHEEGVRRHTERAFVEYGLPERVRMDNGTPFVTRSVGGLSRWMIWLVELGITPERIELGHPEQNGVHERMHRTLKEAVCRPPCGNLLEQQRAFDRFRQEFNFERPHEALSLKVPGRVYLRSYRPYPCPEREPEYGPGREVRRVKSNGVIQWRGSEVPLSRLLEGKPVGLREVGEQEWEVCFGPVWLARVVQRANGELSVWHTRESQSAERRARRRKQRRGESAMAGPGSQVQGSSE